MLSLPVEVIDMGAVVSNTIVGFDDLYLQVKICW
jgi:hypothetical protein